MTITATDAAGAESPVDTLTFVITRTGRIDTSITVSFALGGTALLGSRKDYTLSVTGGTLNAKGTAITLAAGVTTATITLTPVRDTAAEAPETVTITLTAGSGCTVSAPSGATGTITDIPAGPAAVLPGRSIPAVGDSAASAGMAVVPADPVTIGVIRPGELGSGAPLTPVREPAPRPVGAALAVLPQRPRRASSP